MTPAESKWDARRAETTRRLRHCALELTRDKGLDGWTMDDLAEVAEVSRRTVFNYFDSKIALVLGPDEDLSPEAQEQFVAGGPTGELIEDMVLLSAGVVRDHYADVELAQLGRSVILGDPELVGLVHQRYEAKVEQAAEWILRREGEQYGARRAALLVRLFVIAFDQALEQLESHEPLAVVDALRAAVVDARDVLTPRTASPTAAHHPNQDQGDP